MEFHTHIQIKLGKIFILYKNKTYSREISFLVFGKGWDINSEFWNIYIYIYYFYFINFLRTCTAFNFSVNSQKCCESYRWLYSQIRKHGEREMRFRAAFRVCESRNRAPLLLQPQASRSFSQLPLFKPPTVRVASLFSVYIFLVTLFVCWENWLEGERKIEFMICV